MKEIEELFECSFPFWDSLTEEEQAEMILGTTRNTCGKKTRLHFGGGECAGVQIIETGRARIFITSPNGGDITLFRLMDGDVSILSAACMLNGMDVELDMEMETDCIIYTIPKKLYKKLYEENGAVKDYTMEMVSEKFSDIMWLFNQFVFSNVASRLAGVLLEHRAMEGKDVLPVTHEVLARDAGTAREVVSRLLKQFQADDKRQSRDHRRGTAGKNLKICLNTEWRINGWSKRLFLILTGRWSLTEKAECRKAQGWLWKR